MTQNQVANGDVAVVSGSSRRKSSLAALPPYCVDVMVGGPLKGPVLVSATRGPLGDIFSILMLL